ncbi:hypothetical protein AsFcp4_177 [Aeromonas phage AsFcp_4]|nr:hypothetical protein ASfcp2_266 [Aeromonas phage AsFcp_2]QAX99630.1 hypothetical protein AsFcp4_177 [Aeromonas phage AsFcp_4]
MDVSPKMRPPKGALKEVMNVLHEYLYSRQSGFRTIYR